ncbi:MAG: helix-turn-helix domain-containing protein, partial [Euryarchaeota archaeon]|nr:helix-turn-helix domain-containing protein [Euryarchaeota archaeon]
MKKAFQFRIYPNKNQEVKLNKTLSTCRRLYNDSLAERERQAELNRLKKEFEVFPWGKPEWINYYDQANDLSGSKTDFQKEVFSQVLQNVRNGEQIEPPEFLRESEKKLTQEQKRLSRKKKRSQNRDHQRIVVAKVHRKIRNQRKDFTHKTSRMLV